MKQCSIQASFKENCRKHADNGDESDKEEDKKEGGCQLKQAGVFEEREGSGSHHA